MKDTLAPRRSRIRGLIAASAVAVVAPLGLAALATPADAAASKTGLYIIQVSGSPVATYTGGVAGLSRTKPVEGERVDSRSSAAKAYSATLVSQHAAVLSRAKVAVSARTIDYTTAFNGFAARLTKDQAKQVERTPGVVHVWADEIRTTDTIRTPGFLGLSGPTGVWQTKLGGLDKAGLGVIVGIIDSGFWPESASFASLPSPRPDATRIARKWHGTCDVGENNPVTCNNKVIGARYYHEGVDVESFEFLSPRDYNGHGSHTASTAAGNYGVDAVINGGSVGSMSGMAPQARIAVYKGLWATPDGRASGSTADLVHAIDDAVADGVDVINYSISGSSTYVVSPDEIAFLNAADAGVFVSTSAGNSGDTVGESSVAHNSPWTMTVAASTSDRGTVKSVTLGNGTTYTGLGVGGAVGPAPVADSSVLGLDGADPTALSLCFSDADSDPTNGIQPVLDPAKVAGKIVICTRGTNARVDKSAAVKAAGGVGMILANASDAQTLNADFHAVPTVHLTATDGAAVKAYAAAGGSPTATINATDTTPVRAPEMAGFSSYGPALAGDGNLLKPDITAPGVDIIAAVSPAGDPDGNSFNAESGTSMSAPHIAGIAALITQAHPKWSPMTIKSALMTSATTLDNKGLPIQRAGADATPLDYGAGHVRPANAFSPGLVYNSTSLDWIRYGCGIGQFQLITDPSFCQTYGSVDPSNLNYPSIAVGALAGSKVITRTVTNPSSRGERYVASVKAPPGFTAAVNPRIITVPPGASTSFTVTLTRTSAPLGEWAFGSLTWRSGYSRHIVTSPIALRPVAVSAPREIAVTGASGSTMASVTPGYTGSLTATAAGLVEGLDQVATTTLAANSTVTVTIPEGTRVARFATYDADYPAGTDIDLVVSKDGVEVGSSAGGTSEEEVTLEAPAAGTYEVTLDLFAGADPTDIHLVSYALGSSAAGNLTVTPASQAVRIGTAASVSIAWTGLDPAKRYLGAAIYGDGTSTVGRTLVNVLK